MSPIPRITAGIARLSLTTSHAPERAVPPAETPLHAAVTVARHAKSAGREGLQRLLEDERYRFEFSIHTVEQLRAVLAACADQYRQSGGKRALAIVCGGGIVGLSLAIRLKQRYGYNVIVLENRTHATRPQVLDFKRSTLKEWPPDLVAQLVGDKRITRSACRAEDMAGKLKLRPAGLPHSIIDDLARPQPRYYPQLRAQPIRLPPVHPTASADWCYPIPEYDDDSDFYDTYALGQTRDVQIGMRKYCRALGIDMMHGTVSDLIRDGGEFVAELQLAPHQGSGAKPPDAVRSPADMRTVIAITEGRTTRWDAGFGGSEEIQVDEIWHQRNYIVQPHGRALAHKGGSAICFDEQGGSALFAQIWDGPDGQQANVSVMYTPERRAATGTPEAQTQLDASFAQAQDLLDRFKIPLKIVYDSETYRSPPIPITLTRARNPVHQNVFFLGDSAGLSSPFNSRGANDSIIGQLRIVEEYLNDPGYRSADLEVRKGAQQRARDKFNAVYQIRHGTALELLLRYRFYTDAQADEIRASLVRERREC